MKRKSFISVVSLCFLALFFLLPSEGFAVDFAITDVKIEAELQGNGNVLVKETHTYEFDGEFNGITREVIPKEGTSIQNFHAEENGKSLKIEQEDQLFKVHRKGSDETITVELEYLIGNGVDIYQDVADFYWPFFDDRNESTYEQLQIIVHPPKETEDVIAFGYDEAFETEQILQDGSVLFNLGEVPYEENGDIRVAYDVSLFPSASLTSEKPMKEKIIQAKQDLLEEAALKMKRQEQLTTFGGSAILIFALILFILILSTSRAARNRKRNVEQEYDGTFFVPKQIMSLPATISYTNGNVLPAEAMAAALLDLVRRGIVKKTADNGFRLVQRETELRRHEQILIELLFDKIGKNGIFSFDDLTSYTKNKVNHSHYQTFKANWNEAVRNEVSQYELYEDKTKYRTTVGISSLLLLPLLVLFPMYDLFGWMFITILLLVSVLIYAISYHPKTFDGLRLSHEWQLFKRNFRDLSDTSWGVLTEDERMRAYLYGLGMNEKNLREKNRELVESFEPSRMSHSHVAGIYAPTDMTTIAYFGPIASSNFHTANQTSESTTNSSSSVGGGGGGGVGGGGGGSGAF
ncbi:DUF2207 domain-containing protein [Litchfieldia salsa]|uniref:Uncharacterized membrane protein n=1 Tax=Litchfieldia salsa TaxID=930152 RepID=A0A1H0W3V3_9BACI|nr:DUF2207 domain-containing protein [Litchfieldia salsa]SDP85238.1 Uncharacterized membrane protein [Litchfieldia salsa]